MAPKRDELKLLSEELKNPYQQLNLIFLLMSLLPALSCIYILYGKVLVDRPLPVELVPILFFSNLLMILGYIVGCRLIKSVMKKVLGYSTRARLSEEQRAAMAVALAHDLKSPLAVIKANMGNLKAGLLGPLSPKQAEMAELCSGVTDRTAALLMDLIKSYTPQREPSEIVLSRFDLNAAVEEQLREMGAVAGAKNISLRWNLVRTPLRLHADRAMVIRLINNLLSNAVKYTPADGQIAVKSARTENFARLEFQNSGAPIPEAMLERIFETRERLDDASEGHGLGLGIARAIAEAHHGKVWAESGDGRPNTFLVLLPIGEDP